MIYKLLFTIIISVSTLLLMPLSASARNLFSTPCSVSGSQSSATCTGNKNQSSANNNPAITTLRNVTNIVSIVGGAASVIILLIGGMKYVTSDGDTNKITGAKNTIIYALVGLAVIAIAQVIILYVVNQL
ncbi:MAG: pilin [Candidatus Saccharimonadales bacterium]